MLRISWPLWMDWIISRIHSFSCSMADAVSRKASTLTDTFKSTLAQCKIGMIQCFWEEREQQRDKCTACTFGTHAAAACCWQLYLASSWSKLSRSRPERAAMDRLLLNLAVVASVIFACILARAMPECDGGSRLWSAREETRPHGAQLAWLWRDSSDAPGSAFPILGCGFFTPSAQKLPEETRREVSNVWSADHLEVLYREAISLWMITCNAALLV